MQHPETAHFDHPHDCCIYLASLDIPRSDIYYCPHSGSFLVRHGDCTDDETALHPDNITDIEPETPISFLQNQVISAIAQHLINTINTNEPETQGAPPGPPRYKGPPNHPQYTITLYRKTDDPDFSIAIWTTTGNKIDHLISYAEGKAGTLNDAQWKSLRTAGFTNVDPFFFLLITHTPVHHKTELPIPTTHN